MVNPDEIRNFEDAECFARRRVPPSLAQQIEGGSGRATTITANYAAFDELRFTPRMAVSFPSREMSTSVLGHEISIPVLTAPLSNARIYHRDGEPGIARAAGAAGTIACISTLTGYPIERVIAAATGPIFFQLYYLGGRNNVECMIDRVRRAGVEALILTVDAAAWYKRERGARHRLPGPASRSDQRAMLRFAPQALRRPRWLAGFIADGMRFQAPMALHPDGRPYEMREAAMTIATPVWSDIEWIGEQFGGPVIVKGVLSVEDARRAVAAGAAAVIVSNHGGNALDGVPAALAMLPSIVDAVGHEVEVLMDSGIRNGTDVVKALALGARAVLIGRAHLWAHAAAGSAGVSRMLEVLRRHIDAALGLLGCESVRRLDRSYLRIPASWERLSLGETARPRIAVEPAKIPRNPSRRSTQGRTP